MKTPLFVKNSVIIQATPSTVWDVLTNPDQTRKYMFGCETVSDWRAGSPLLWRGQYEGKEMIFVKGEIVKIQPGVHLTYTTIDPNSSIDDTSENYLNVTYDLKPEDGGTALFVTQGDYSTVADGERRYKEASNEGDGWNPILVQIKKIAEEIDA